MTESERLAEVAALHHERKRKAEELAAIDRRIELVLFPLAGESTTTGQPGNAPRRMLVLLVAVYVHTISGMLLHLKC